MPRSMSAPAAAAADAPRDAVGAVEVTIVDTEFMERAIDRIEPLVDLTAQ